MMALLLLFAPPDFAMRVQARWSRIVPWRSRRWAVAALVLAVLAALAVFSAAAYWDPSATLQVNARRTWFAGGYVASWWLFDLAYLAVVPLFGGLLFRDDRAVRGVRALVVGPSWRLSVVPALVLFNGLCPYLGLKTETAFAMYSNLRTEGGATNHLIFRRPLSLAYYQEDLVRVVESSDAAVQRAATERRPLPYYALRQAVRDYPGTGHPPMSLTYDRGGVVRSVDDARADPELMAQPGYLERKFLRFREIRNECAH
jgi:hypothetical protein